MPEYTEIDESVHDEPISHEHITKTTPQGTQFDGVTRGHEHRDVSVKSLAMWFIGLFCFVIVACFGIAGAFFGVLHYQARNDTVPSATFKSSIINAAPSREARLVNEEKVNDYLPTITQQPPLMPVPHDPMLVLRARENHEVNSYGYVKNAEGKRVGVHIPVAKAMDIALKKGFAVQASPSSLRPPAPVSPALDPAQDKGY